VSAMISTTLIPRACKIIEGGALDAYSDKHIKRVIDFVEEVEASIEPDNAKFQMLLKSIFNVFSAAVSDSEALLQHHNASSSQPSSFNPESIPARRRILARQSKLLANILRWRRFCKDRLALNTLVTRQLNLINVYAGTGWEVGGQEFMQKIHSSLPPELTQQ
jgi:GC-rich sequence DNA-binding factor